MLNKLFNLILVAGLFACSGGGGGLVGGGGEVAGGTQAPGGGVGEQNVAAPGSTANAATPTYDVGSAGPGDSLRPDDGKRVEIAMFSKVIADDGTNKTVKIYGNIYHTEPVDVVDGARKRVDFAEDTNIRVVDYESKPEAWTEVHLKSKDGQAGYFEFEKTVSEEKFEEGYYNPDIEPGFKEGLDFKVWSKPDPDKTLGEWRSCDRCEDCHGYLTCMMENMPKKSNAPLDTELYRLKTFKSPWDEDN